MKRTLVIGARDNPDQFAYKATVLLKNYGHEVVALGMHPGSIEGTPIQTEWPTGENFDTITLYVNPTRQGQFEELIQGINPKRVIFNPGTENSELEDRLEKSGIEVLEACTLVMLKTNQY